MNDSAVRYMETGQYEPNDTVPTLSNAMDVGKPSNFVRVLELFGHEYEDVRDVLSAYRLSDEETVATIQRVSKEHGYLLDPHTAVGWEIAERYGDPDKTRVLCATASPIKFAGEIGESAGIDVDNAAEIAKLQERPQHKTTIPNDYTALTQLLLNK